MFSSAKNVVLSSTASVNISSLKNHSASTSLPSQLKVLTSSSIINGDNVVIVFLLHAQSVIVYVWEFKHIYVYGVIVLNMDHAMGVIFRAIMVL